MFGPLQKVAIIDLLPPGEWDQIEIKINMRYSLLLFRSAVAHLVWKRLRPKRTRKDAKARQKRIKGLRDQLPRTILELQSDPDEGFLVMASGLEAALPTGLEAGLHRFEEMHVSGRQPEYDDHALYSALAKLFKFYTDNDPGYTENRFYGQQVFSGTFVDLATFVDKLIAAATNRKTKANQTIGAIVKTVVKHKNKVLPDPY
jgi:hypothetical protein